jgi:stage II sporulation protein D
VKCDWCRDARLYRWTAEVSKRDAQADLEPLLRREGRQPGALKSVSLVRPPGQGSDSLPEFDLRAERQTVRVTGAELRQALSARGLFSPRFTIEDKGQTWLISGRGHGHGVGLCQWGARGLALSGKDCGQILEYYYSGAKVTKSP